MSRDVQYRSVSLEVAAGVVDRKISLPHSTLEFTVPITTVNATVRFGDPGAELVALQAGGKTKFCFGDTPPSAIYLTVPGGDPIVVFGSQEVEPTFAPFPSIGAGVVDLQSSGTWPEPIRAANDGVLATSFQFLSGHSSSQLFFGGPIPGSTAPDDMALVDGRLCYEARSTNVSFMKREWAFGFPIHLPLTDLLGPDQEHSEFQRVYWDTFWLRATGIPTVLLGGGIAYVFWNNTPGDWYDVANFRGWGLPISSEGGVPTLHYAANRVFGGPLQDEDVNLNIVLTTWRRIDVVHLAPSETRRARLLIWVDAALVIEREWAAGAGPLPDYALLGGSIVRWVKTPLSVAGMTLNFGGVVTRRGQMRFDGTFA